MGIEQDNTPNPKPRNVSSQSNPNIVPNKDRCFFLCLGFVVLFCDCFLFLWFLLMCGAYCSSLWFCLLVFASCFLLFAPCFLLPSFCFCCLCFLLSALYRFCFLLVAFSLMRFAFSVLFLLSAFCFLLLCALDRKQERLQQNYCYYYCYYYCDSY